MRNLVDWIRRPSVAASNPAEVRALLARCAGRVHLGCNTVKVDGYVNVDVRATSATDIVHDCRDVSMFPSESVKIVYSNAFFEHVYVNDRLPLLKDIRRSLERNGYLLFTGLPDFEGVARAYLEKKPGNVSQVFDLHEAYRYTHGDPEGRESWWLAQLHKGLFDAETLEELVRKADFASATVFAYCWGKEPNSVTLGCVAHTSARAAPTNVADIRSIVGALPSNIAYDSLVIKRTF
jgi:predicted SAM-dependent methyltransferase